ncbi:hypothetical protein [Lacrimispora sp.]|nr:hypothetical protein [Lacrimispora sp.]
MLLQDGVKKIIIYGRKQIGAKTNRSKNKEVL